MGGGIGAVVKAAWLEVRNHLRKCVRAQVRKYASRLLPQVRMWTTTCASAFVRKYLLKCVSAQVGECLRKYLCWYASAHLHAHVRECASACASTCASA